jgi:hypothetical protein
MADQLLALDPLDERVVKVEHAVDAQHVSHQAVSGHRQSVQVGRWRDALPM